jgi:hypothetical protein
MLHSPLLVFFLAFLLGLQGTQSFPASKADSPLLAAWASTLTPPFSITTVDPITGQKGRTLFTGSEYVVLPVFQGTNPCLDHGGRRIFFPLLRPAEPPRNVYVVAFHLPTGPDANTTVIGSVSIPRPYNLPLALEYDPLKDRVLLLSTSSSEKFPRRVQIGAVTFGNDGKYANLTLLPPDLTVPAIQAGIPIAFDAASRILVFPTMRQDGSMYLSQLDVDSLRLNNIPQIDFLPSAWAYNAIEGNYYGFLIDLPFNDSGRELTWGTIDTLKGSIKAIAKWGHPHLERNVGAAATLDPQGERFYSSFFAHGGRSLVTVEPHTGQLLHSAFAEYTLLTLFFF